VADHDASVADVPDPNFASDLRNSGELPNRDTGEFRRFASRHRRSAGCRLWLAPASAVTGVSAANFDIDVCWSAAPRAAICSSAASCSASRYLDVDRGTRPAARVFGRQPFDVTFATQIARGGVNQNFFRTPSDAGIVRHHRPLTNALTADCEKFGDGTGQTLGFQAEKSNKRCSLSNSYLDLFNRG